MSKPNIFIILLDTLRRDRLGAYGYSRDTSPNLDRFAAEATRFDNAYTSAPWTLPAHTSLFTGLASEEHGVTGDLCTLDETAPTLAEQLAAAGYLCLGYSSNPFVGTIYGLSRGFHRFVNAHELRTDFSPPADWDRAAPVEADKGAADIVRRFTEDLRSIGKDGRPVFGFFNLSTTHSPYYPPTPFRLRYWRELGHCDTAIVDAALAASESSFNVMTGRVALCPRGYQLLNAWYDGCVRYADYRAGELLDLIRASGRVDSSMIAVLSDHGELLGERGIVGHTWSVLDPVVHIPLMVRFAGNGTSSTCSALVQIHDVFATVLAAAGVDAPPGHCVDLVTVAATGAGRSAAITDRARIDNHGLTFQMLTKTYASEYADPYDPIHRLIQPAAALRSVVTLDRKVNLSAASTYQHVEFEWGTPDQAGMAGVLEWIGTAYRQYCGRDVSFDSVACRPRPGFDFMEELQQSQVSERLRKLGYID